MFVGSVPYRPIRLAALVAFVTLTAGAPLAAQSTPVIFADSEFPDWQVTRTSGAVELLRTDGADPHLTVRHRHATALSSVRSSTIASPRATYAPAERGGLGSISVSARFRPHFTGFASGGYAIRAITAKLQIHQGGRDFPARVDLFRWMNQLPLDVWLPASSGNLAATDFWLDGTTPEHPDLSSTGSPLSFSLLVVSSFQTGGGENIEHRFELDIARFSVLGSLLAPGAAPALSYEPLGNVVDSDGGDVALYGAAVDPIDRATVGIPVRLSVPADAPLAFSQALIDDAGERTSAGGGAVAAGAVQGAGYVMIDRTQLLVEIEPGAGFTLGSPARAVIYAASEHTALCSAEYMIHWFNFLACLNPSSPECRRQQQSRTSQVLGSTRDLLPTLRAFRSGTMATSVAGRRLSALYDTFSPELTRAMVASPALLLDLYRSYEPWSEAIGSLVDGDGDQVAISADMSDGLNRLLDRFAAAGSPALARAIATERVRLGLDGVSGLTMDQFWQRVEERGGPETCTASANTLCLNGGRFRLEADFVTFEGASGRAGAVPLSGDSGYFWFFDEANVEILAKVLEGCGVNDRVWSYNAGLTNLHVEMLVLDAETGNGKLYRNDGGQSFAPILDSDFVPCSDPPRSGAERDPAPVVPAAAAESLGGCVADDTSLCILDDRFRVRATWTTASGATGSAHAVALTADTGTFWFFGPDNVELVVKAIDACGLAGFDNFWIFAAGTTDVAVELTVTDTVAGREKVYRRPLGAAFAPVLDSAAFATCDAGSPRSARSPR